MDKQRNITIEHRSYVCHPETCCHKDHYTFWVLEDGNYIQGFDNKSEAETFIKILVDKEIEHKELETEWLEMNQQHEQAVEESFLVNAENRKLQAKVEDLQKRVDAVEQVINKIRNGNYASDSGKYVAIFIGQMLEQALKGADQ